MNDAYTKSGMRLRHSSIPVTISFATMLLCIMALLSSYVPSRTESVSKRYVEHAVRSTSTIHLDDFILGNALADGKRHSGWLVGHFMVNGTLQHTNDVEVKFTMNPKGKSNEAVTANRVSRSMAILVAGKHRMFFGNTSVVLENVGDYALWGAGISHSWTALEDSTIVTIRWPSIREDQFLANQW